LKADLFATATDRAVTEVLTKVGLWYDLKERGGLGGGLEIEMLSYDQRQLFCLTRAMLGRGMVVVLDEATSSVDVVTDRLMRPAHSGTNLQIVGLLSLHIASIR
jgi:ATP-binding cassette, subfamily C (CFTR/MRP), member 1